ncbi:MAG: hypothetical protein Q7R97_03935 [Candidatus Daviesbacteria bacterium]|nr:hypothetical protein [Candidatus Daviesbacteria bacterium]
MIGQMFHSKAQKYRLKKLGTKQSSGMMDQVKKMLVDADQRLILMVRN